MPSRAGKLPLSSSVRLFDGRLAGTMRVMKTVDGQPVTKGAEHLGSDELHIWRMVYDRHQGRAPLRRLLAAYLHCDSDDVELVESEHGRPELASAHASPLSFNW